MAIITKRRKAYTVIHKVINEQGNAETVYETFYDYTQALDRKAMIEGNIDYLEISPSTKLVDFLIKYTTTYGRKLWSNSKYENILGLINNYLKNIFDDMEIKDIKKGTAKKILNKMKVTPAIGKRNQKAEKYMPLSMQYIAYVFLKRCFDYLVSEKLINHNEFHDFSFDKNVHKVYKNNWSIETFNKIMDNCNEINLYLFLHIIFSTGLDISEILALSWDDLLVDNRSIYIYSNKLLKRRSLTTFELINKELIVEKYKNIGSTNTNTALVLYKKDTNIKKVELSVALYRVLKEWKILQAHGIDVNVNPYQLIFVNFGGRAYEERVLTKKFNKMIIDLEIKDVTLATLKSFGKKKDENGKLISQKYYEDFGSTIKLPRNKTKAIYSKKEEEHLNQKAKLDGYLPEEQNNDLSNLLQKLKENPELKNQIVSKLISEQ